MNNIQWMKGAKYWDKCWNPVIGCVPVSEGCEHCYAKRTVERFNMNGGDFTPVFKDNKPPRKGIVFAGNMSDWFADFVPDNKLCDWLAQLSTNAVNIILTKRAERLERFIRNWSDPYVNRHLWFGVTCENQQRADERIPHLLRLKGINRWLSLEPLLGSIDAIEYLCDRKACNDWGSGTCDNEICPSRKIDWVVVGAESGPDARPCKIEWIEHVARQCQNANVPVFVKQIHDEKGNLITDINRFPEHLRIRQMPFKEC